MEDEELSERKLRLASIINRVRNMKTKYQLEEGTTDELKSRSPADVTDHSDHSENSDTIRATNHPEEWLSYLQKLEEKGDPKEDIRLRNKLIDLYSEAVDALPAEKHSRNENYAHIMVRFAQLKALEDPDDAHDQFQLAKLNCKTFAFVHIAFAQFELSRGNVRKSKTILQKALEVSAVPTELLEIAFQNLLQKKPVLISQEDKENIPVVVPSTQDTQDPAQYSAFEISRHRNNSDSSSGELPVNMSVFSLGADHKNDSTEEADAAASCGRKPLMLLKSTTSKTGSVPVQPLVTPDAGHCLKKIDAPSTSCSMKRQTSGSRVICRIMPSLPKPKQNGASGDDDSYNLKSLKSVQSVSPTALQMSDDDDQCTTDSTMTLLNKTDAGDTAKAKEGIVLQMGNLEEAHMLSSHNEMNKKLEVGQPKDSENLDQPRQAGLKTATQLKTRDRISPEAKRAPSEQPMPLPIPKRVPLHGASAKESNLAFVCETPSNKPVKNYMDCFRTPVVNNNLPPMSHGHPSGYQQVTPTSATPFQRPNQFKVTTPQASSDSIVIKGRVYTILKQIGVGGSSKVFQVLDEKKQLYAVKYVNFEEADEQTIESYQNEIAHLCRLQQHSDKIIRLYDYDIAENRIYMVLECGNIDLNTWLRKKKTINPWERKSYWKNMLEAVHTIHQHGIIHSDLKPANFLIVDGMLKLIDFGIANQMQPDVTSIVKDSQVGTINFMPPEAIKDMSSYGENGKPRSKISPKSDVWSLGCILYCMTYGKTPFQHITNQITKLNAIIDPNYEIEFPAIPEKDLQNVLKRCLVRNPRERISIAELLVHPYVHIQPPQQPGEQPSGIVTEEMKRILGQLIGLKSPNSISRAARGLYDQFSSGKNLDMSAFAKPSDQKAWQM